MSSFSIINVLNDFLSPHEETRVKASKYLEQTGFQEIFYQLLNVLISGVPAEIQNLAVALMRSRLKLFWNEYEKNKLRQTNSKVIEFIVMSLSAEVLRVYSEQQSSVKRRLPALIGLIAHIRSKTGTEWEELWKYINDGLTGWPHQSSEDRLIDALNLLECTCEYHSCLALFRDDPSALVKHLGRMLRSTSPSSCDVKLCVIRVVCAIDEGIFSTLAEAKFLARYNKIGFPKDESYKIRKALRGLSRDIIILISEKHKEVQIFNGKEELLTQLDEYLRGLSSITEVDRSFCNDEIFELFETLFGIVSNNEYLPYIKETCIKILAHVASGFLVKTRKTARKGQQTAIRQENEKAIAEPSLSLSETSRGSGPSVEENRNLFISGLLRLFYEIFINLKEFDESDSEWINHREDEPLNGGEENFTGICISLIGELIHVSGSGELCGGLVQLSAKLTQSPDGKPVACVLGLRILSQILEENPDTLKETILHISGLLLEYCDNSRVSCMRVRWWSLVVLADAYSHFSEDLPWESVRLSMSSLVNVFVKDDVARCKRRALTALYVLLSGLSIRRDEGSVSAKCLSEEETSLLWESLVRNVVYPALDSGDDQLRELGLAILSALAETCPKSSEFFYEESMSTVKRILDQSLLNTASLKEVQLCEVAVSLADNLCTAVGPQRCQKDLDHLVKGIVCWLERFVQKTGLPEVDSLLFFSTLTKSLGTLVFMMNREFLPYAGRVSKIFTEVMRQSDQTEIRRIDSQGIVTYDVPDLSSLVKLAEGKANLREERGITHFSVKEKDGVDKVFELKTQVIEEKSACIALVAQILRVDFALWSSFVEETVHAITQEAKTPYSMIRKAIVDLADATVSSFLASEHETLREADSDLLTSSQTERDKFAMIVNKLTTSFITEASNSSLRTAAELMEGVKAIMKSLQQGFLLGKLSLDTLSDNFPQMVFEALGKILACALSSDLEPQETDPSAQMQDSNKNTDEESGADSTSSGETGTSAELEADFEETKGKIFSDIGKSVQYCFWVYKGKCIPLWETYLKTLYSTLLVVPEVNMEGRAAALLGFGLYFEYCNSEPENKLAEDVLPLAVLYAKSNEAGLKEQWEEETSQNSVYDEDVPRIQSACYAIGVISRCCPNTFLRYFEISVQTLKDVFKHPLAEASERRSAAESSLEALLKIVSVAQYRERLLLLNVDEKTLVDLLSKWFPAQPGEEESETLLVSMLELALGDLNWYLLANSAVRHSMLEGFRIVKADMESKSKPKSQSVLMHCRLNRAIESLSGVGVS